MKHLQHLRILALVAAGLLPGERAQAAVPQACPQNTTYWHSVVSFDETISDHRLFPLPVLHYTQAPAENFGFYLALVIDTQGDVVCYHYDPGGAIPAKRQPVIDALADWHYTPFLSADQPATTTIVEFIPEDQPPVRHVTMPEAPLSRSSIRLGTPLFAVTLPGNGKGVFHDQAEWATGNRTRRLAVPPGDVSALIERLRSADAWSLDDTYVRPTTYENESPWTLTITIGEQTKTITFRGPEGGPERSGLSPAMVDAIREAYRLAAPQMRVRLPVNDPVVPIAASPPAAR